MKTQPCVLYVEDEQDDVFFMRDAFLRLGMGAVLRVAEDGERAIAYLAGSAPFADRDEHPVPACVLLDLNLPAKSGFEVLEWLRGRPEFRELPVVVFSSSGRLEDRRRAQQLGATDYILKPGSGREFIVAARRLHEEWLGGGPATEPA